LTTLVGINGAPLLVDPTGVGLNGTRPANPWLKPKGNTLSVSLAKPPPTVAVILSPVALPAVQFHAQVHTVIPDSPTNEIDRILATFDWAAANPVPLPVNREIAFEITAPPPTKLWAEATPVTGLSTADKQQLRTLVQKHAEAIESRNLDGLSALLDYKTKDCALANGQDPERMRQVTRQQYTQEMFSEPSFKVEGAEADALEFRLVAGGQVVWMFQSLAKPALVVLSPNKRFTLPIYAAMIGGAWRIVR
jgi:hypothetical protein